MDNEIRKPADGAEDIAEVSIENGTENAENGTVPTATAEENLPTEVRECGTDTENEISTPDTAEKDREAEEVKCTEDKEAEAVAEPPKRKRGRPRKTPVSDTDADKDSTQLTMDIPDGAPVFGISEIKENKTREEALSEGETETADAEKDNTPHAELTEEASEGTVEIGNSNTASSEEADGAEEFIIPSVDTDVIFPAFSDDEEFTDEEEKENEEEDFAEETELKEPVSEPIPKKAKAPRPPKKEREVGSRGIDTLFDFLELFIFTFVGVLLVTTFIFRHSVVSGNSMLNTLHDGDKLIISDLFYSPDYGDIVVVEDHTAGITSPIVKRVIALEGDTVRVTHGGIFVNGVLEETVSYVYTDGVAYFYDLDDYRFFKDYDGFVFEEGQYYEFTVPEDEIYVLGDHRNDSTDSRKRGTVREDSVLGRVIVRFYPFEDFKFFN